MFRKIAAITVAGASLILLTGQVDAARGGNSNKDGGSRTSPSATFAIEQAAPYVHGQQITFTVVSDLDRPFSLVECSQGGTLVYSSSRGHFEDYYLYFGEPIHTLSSLAWPSGAADCTASLVSLSKNGSFRTHASFGFQASG